MVAGAPSERELDVLKVLWRLGESPVRDVHAAMCLDGECAFTTVQTLLRIMAGKGLVTQRIEARTLYYAAMTVQYSALLPSFSVPVLPAQASHVILQDSVGGSTVLKPAPGSSRQDKRFEYDRILSIP